MGEKDHKASNLVGRRYGRLVVVAFHHSDGEKRFWLCKCDCGGEKVVSTGVLNYGAVASCGCLKLETQRKNRTKVIKHGFSHKERLYEIWKNMRRRCYDPTNKRAEHYYRKGVTVCDEWNDYAVFREWALNNGYSDNLTLDRIDNNGNYSPSNCRWATPKQQANNTSRNRMITYAGKTMTMSEWADCVGLTYAALNHRMQRHWPVGKALTTPQRRHVNGHYVT